MGDGGGGHGGERLGFVPQHRAEGLIDLVEALVFVEQRHADWP